MLEEVNTVVPANRQEWREWLEKHHDTQPSAWLVYHKKKSGRAGLTYSEAVEEALCFGWIDSTARPVDEHTYRQFFCPRKPMSGWSKVNKARIQHLTDAGLMAESGIASVERAKENGSWLLLDDAEALLIPADLDAEFQKKPTASDFFAALSRSDKRILLIWVTSAKRAETRQKRIAELVESADQRQKPGVLTRQKKQPDGKTGTD